MNGLLWFLVLSVLGPVSMEDRCVTMVSGWNGCTYTWIESCLPAVHCGEGNCDVYKNTCQYFPDPAGCMGPPYCQRWFIACDTDCVGPS